MMVFRSMAGVSIAPECNMVRKRCFSVFLLKIVLGFDYAISEGYQPIATLKCHFAGLVEGIFHYAKRQPSDCEPFDDAGLTAQDGIVVSGVDVGQSARHRIEFGNKCSGEAAAILAVAAGIAIHSPD